MTNFPYKLISISSDKSTYRFNIYTDNSSFNFEEFVNIVYRKETPLGYVINISPREIINNNVSVFDIIIDTETVSLFEVSGTFINVGYKDIPNEYKVPEEDFNIIFKM